MVCAHEQVACDRGGGHYVERVDPGGQGAWMHGNADGLIGLVQPAGRQAIAFGAEQKRSPLAGDGRADRRGRPVRRQREQPEPSGPQAGQAVAQLAPRLAPPESG